MCSMKLKTFLIVVTIACFSNTLYPQQQSTSIGNWVMIFNQTKLHNKWSLHNEVQFRSYTVNPNTEQLLLRVGVNFHPSKNVLLTTGYGWITNYKNDEGIIKNQLVDEQRLWQQLSLKDSYGRFFIEHRYRMEERWITNNLNSEYKNRIRYLLRLSIPINNKQISKNTLFFTAYDELFVNLTILPFDRNRLYGALAFQFNDLTNLQIGYLAQTVSTTTKHYLQFVLNYNLDFRKKSD
jgi:hypothetical protein